MSMMHEIQVAFRCLKITEKVSFNIASEASYVYILSGQKLIKNAKNGQFGEFLKNWSVQSNSTTRQVNFNRTKMVENAKIEKFKYKIMSSIPIVFAVFWEQLVFSICSLQNWKHEKQ